jgi:hypothetical protein
MKYNIWVFLNADDANIFYLLKKLENQWEKER